MSFPKTNQNNIDSLIKSVRQFETEAHRILGIHEDSRSRIITLGSTYSKLSALSLSQDELFRQALRCMENDLNRAAHVMAWAGFVDFLDMTLAADGFIKLKMSRPNWTFNTVEDLREISTEHARIMAAKDIGLCNKTEMKALHGLLNKRNECAHPSGYYSDLNQTLGYISELLKRIEGLEGRYRDSLLVPTL